MTDKNFLNQGIRTLFFETIHALVRLEFLTTDTFVITKTKTFVVEIVSLFSEYEFLSRVKKGTNGRVAQYYGLNKAGVDRVLLGLEYIQHFNAVPPAPLLEAISLVLKIKSELFFDPENSKTQIQTKIPVGKKETNSQNRIEKVNGKNSAMLSENKKKILEFISQSSSVRPKNVLNQFNHLTKRTVKRNLQELFQAGFLKKENRDKAVLYTVAKD